MTKQDTLMQQAILRQHNEQIAFEKRQRVEREKALDNYHRIVLGRCPYCGHQLESTVGDCKDA